MQTIPTWLQQAFSDWVIGRTYVDGRGNYRSRALGHRIVPYNRSLKRLYPENRDFHRAAHAWLELWGLVPIARFVETDSNPAEGVRS